MFSPAASPEAIAARALALRDADDPEAATEMLTAAVAKSPGEPLLWQTLGLMHRALDDSGAAMAALGQAAALAPGDGCIAHALARVTLEAGLPATAAYALANSLLPGDGSVLIGWSAAQLAEGDDEAAIALLANACRMNPEWIEGHAALANLRWLLGDTTGFVASHVDALREQPRSLPLWLALLDRYLSVERYDWAQQALASAYRILGDMVELLPTAAVCASELGQQVEADRLFARLPLASNADLAVRYLRHLLRSGRPDVAASFAEPLATQASYAAAVWPYLATAWRLTGDRRCEWLEADLALVTTVRVMAPTELTTLAACLRRLHRVRHAPLGQSVRAGTQTDGPLFSRVEPEIRDLRDRIRAAVSEHIATPGLAMPDHPTLSHRPAKVRFAGSWSVRLTGAGHHSHHIHPQGWLSSAFYVVVPPIDEAGPPPAGHLLLGVPPAELGLNLPPLRIIAPEAGCLVLFPSTMWHGTAPIAGGERLTVAFDVRPRC